MKRNLLAKRLQQAICSIVFMGFAGTALAQGELIIYVFKNNNAGTGLNVVLDGEQEATVGEKGSVQFDLSEGSHSVQILQGETTQHSFRFNSANGQLVDISVALEFGSEPVVNIESYFKKEAPSVRSRGPKGTLLGRVTSYGQPVAGATVTLYDGLTFSTETDENGSYRIQMPRGVYGLKIEHPDFITQRTEEDIRVIANIELGANFEVIPLDESPRDSLNIARPQVEELIAVAKYRPNALGDSERYSEGVIDTLGIEDLARFGDTQVSASIVRVPSVTVQDNQFIFIRGLGGRYVTTTLNGATLPSTDAAKRSVPLDLFPTNVVSQLDVKKSFTAGMPGESTGGNLVINTRTFPAQAEGQFYARLGGTSGLTGQSVLSDPTRGDFDILGIEDGSRSGAGVFDGISRAQALGPEVLGPGVIQELGRAGGLLLKDDLDPTTTTATPLFGFGGNYGNAFDLDNGGELGFFVAGNYRNRWRQRTNGIERSYSANIIEREPLDDFDFEEIFNTIEMSGLLSVGWNFGNTALSSNTILSRVTDSRVKQRIGQDGDAFLRSARSTIDWVERNFLSQQFTGNHILGADENWTGDWQFTASRADRLAPDRRDIRFDLEGGDGVFNLEVPALLRRWDELTDFNYDLSGQLEYAFSDTTSVEFGGKGIRRERDAESETYGYIGGQAVDDNAPNLLTSDVLTTDTITGDTQTGYSFADKTLASDSYDSKLNLYAAFAQVDTLVADKFQIIAGLRYEDFEQTTNTFRTEGDQGPVEAVLDESEWLPTFNFNWFLTDNQQLRFGVSKTVSRPDFKEQSNAVFFDPDFDVRVRGNPNLDIATAINYDARYEYYWNDADSISFGLFYKDLDKPIERVVLTASGTASNSRTFENAESGEVFGAEVDFRKEFSINDSFSKTIFIATNGSLIESEVFLPELANANRAKPALQGQPEYTFNFVLGYDDIDNDQQITLLLNQNGDTIVDRGRSGRADVILEPRLDLQLNYQWYFAENWQLGLKLQNLLDDEVTFTEDGRIFQEFNTGVRFTANLNWNF